MKKFRRFWRRHWRAITLIAVIVAALYGLLWYRLGNLTGGLGPGEARAAAATYGWHGIYRQPFYLLLDVLRSAVWLLPGHHGQLLSRLPNTIIGALTVISFAALIKIWHGTRTAILGTALFATSAWVLHVSRLASNDVMYLCAIPLLLLGLVLAQRRPTNGLVFYGNVLLWGSLLYTPGLIWLVALTVFWQRHYIADGWRHFRAWWQRSLYALAGLIWLPLLGLALSRPEQWRLWLGLPLRFAAPLHLLKQFGGVGVHLFIRGPQYPEIWLMRAPILDIFTLVMVIFGVYFYARHWRVSRSRILASLFVVSYLLIALGGPVGLSLVVPLLYIVAATGMAFLLHEWLRVFPFNPLARTLGIGLICVAVSLSCLYNVRAYFVAWPNNHITEQTFRYRR